MSLPTYPWFDQVPEHLKTRRQLAEQGLRPGGPVAAQVVWRRGKAHADLYDVKEAKPKRAMSEAQRAALTKAQQAQRTCPSCKTVFAFVLGAHFDCPVCFDRMLAIDRARASAQARTWLRSPRTVILDTETTDLDGYLVQIALIRAHDGAVLLDTLINPATRINPDAQRIHGLSEQDLVSAPTFAQIADELLAMLRGRRIVTYNADFDRGILRNELERLGGGWRVRYASHAAYAVIKYQRWRCAMELFAQFCGDWSEYHGSYKWQRLPEGDHSALGDCKATLAVLHEMAGIADLAVPLPNEVAQ